MSASRLVCAGCGWQADTRAAHPFRCAHAGRDDVDHVLRHELGTGDPVDADHDGNPFVRWRRSLWAWHAARARGLDDAAYIYQVRRLDDAIAGVDGQGFRGTPYARSEALSRRLGLDLWIKDETGNVTGSHKARHLMGILLHLQLVEGSTASSGAPLAIASCGNAALAAAVLAHAASRTLQVYVPPDAEPAVLQRLHALGAQVMVCGREPGEQGDPCMRRFRQALAAGALPFCCQGNENGLAIDGGGTLVLEMLATAAPPLDHLVVQVGGGALASACLQAFERETAAGRLGHAPRVHTVQTQGAWPLQRAWLRLQQTAGSDEERQRHAVTHRSTFMWPWEAPPHSIASGILDDETYDWAAVLRGMARTGGTSAVADEATLVEARRLAHDEAGIRTSATGAAGLAGVLELQRQGLIAKGARVGVLFTGVER